MLHRMLMLAMQVGPFDGQGLPLKGSGLMAIYRFPTVRAA
jgi:hypothetical protein